MRLLFITQDFPPETGGIQTYSFELSKRLAEYSDYFCVLAPQTKDSEVFDKKSAFNIRRFNISNTLLFLALYLRLSGFLKKHPADIAFHAQWQTLPAAIKARKKGQLKKVAAAAHARELLFNPFGRGFARKWYKKYQISLMKQVDMWYPVSDYTARLLLEHGVEPQRIQVTINGTNTDRYYPKDVQLLRKILNIERKKIILTVTRLVGRKGIDLVLEALPRVLEHIRDVHYLVVGTGPEKNRLEGLISEFGLRNHVSLIGNVEYDALPDYYNLADVFVMPSKTEIPDVEGFGIVFLEANACGKPVIGSDSGGIPSAIKDGYNGLIVEENNVAELSEAIIKILNDEEFAKELGNNGLKFVQEKANWETIATTLFEHLNTLIHD